MGVVQRDMKHLKDREKTLEFFLSYLDISKLRLLQILNEKQETLSTLKTIKYTNSSFLDKISKNFFKDEKTFLEADEDSELREKEEIFFLVDSKENDKYSEIMYKKLEETLAEKVKPNDLIVTIGNRVNLIAQKLELNIVQHYPYELYLDQNEFLNKISSLITIGFKNNVFTDATLLIAQQDQEKNQLVSRKLAPFDREEMSEIDYGKTVTIEVSNEDKKDSLNQVVNVEKMRQDATKDYVAFFQDVNVKKMKWVPSVEFFRLKLLEAIIKQNVIESRYIEEIQRLKLDIQLLDEKRNKLSDELVVVKRWVNRVRREKETNAIIVLHSAFKLRNSGNNDLEVIRKKKEEEDLLIKRSSYKGGAK